jgi:Acyltransferase family
LFVKTAELPETGVPKLFYPVFYGRRALRILPLYAVLLLSTPFIGCSAEVPWYYYLTFTQNFLWAAHASWGSPCTGVTWSLAVEEQFYLILPIIVRFCPAAHLPKLLVGLIFATPLLRELAVFLYSNRFAGYLLFPVPDGCAIPGRPDRLDDTPASHRHLATQPLLVMVARVAHTMADMACCCLADTTFSRLSCKASATAGSR